MISPRRRRRQRQRIAAGEDDFPDRRAGADIVERGVERLGRQRGRPARADRLAAEAEAAIDRADVQELQQDAIGIAMHDAGDGAVGGIADRIGALLAAR